jgi:rod shape-determining protein MreC
MHPTNTRSLQSIILALFVIGLVLLALGGYLTPVSRFVLSPLVTAQYWLSTRFQAVQSFIAAPQDLARLRQENTDLQAEISRLEAEIIELNQQLAETRILSALVEFARAHPENSYLASEVIGRDPNPFLQHVYINRGSDDGLRRGMPVVTAQGLVGRVEAVTARAARIQLITATESRVNVMIEPSRAEAILVGQITGDISMEMIPQAADVQVGNLVLTSGLGGNYPANIVVGQVTGVRRRDYDIFQQASVQPVVDFSQLDIVLVITNFRPIDIDPLIPDDAP